MCEIVKYACDELGGAEISCIVENGEAWFKAIDVAKALKYKDSDDAIRKHVSEDDKRQQCSFKLNPGKTPGLQGNWKNAKYINESGLYCLIFGSKLEQAKAFKHWVTRVVYHRSADKVTITTNTIIGEQTQTLVKNCKTSGIK